MNHVGPRMTSSISNEVEQNHYYAISRRQDHATLRFNIVVLRHIVDKKCKYRCRVRGSKVKMNAQYRKDCANWTEEAVHQRMER